MPLWRDVRVLHWVVQLAIVAVVVAIVSLAVRQLHVRTPARRTSRPSFDFLDNPASFQITGNSLSQSAPVRDALSRAC